MATVKARKRKKQCLSSRGAVQRTSQAIPDLDRQSVAMRWAEDIEKAFRNGEYVGNSPPDYMLFGDAQEKYLAETSSKKAKSTHGRVLYRQDP